METSRNAAPATYLFQVAGPCMPPRWLDVRKTLGGLTFEAKKLHWLMSHFSCLLLYFVGYEGPLFPHSCFMAIKNNSHCANITLFFLAWRETAMRKILELLLFFFKIQILKEMLGYGQPLKTEPWVGKAWHSPCVHIRHWNSRRLPFAGEMDHCLFKPWPQLRGTYSLKWSGNVSSKLYATQLLL